jgi:hypothetical protein
MVAAGTAALLLLLWAASLAAMAISQYVVRATGCSARP